MLGQLFWQLLYVRERVCWSPKAQGKRSQSFYWVYTTKSPCWRTVTSKKVPLPPEHLKPHSCMINGQDIQCVHFFLQSYLANAGPFCFTKIELFAVTWTTCHPTLHEMMISCLQGLVSQRAVAKLKNSFHTERSSYLGSSSLDGLLLARMPLIPLRRLNWSHYKNIQALSYCLALQISSLWLVPTTLFSLNLAVTH